LTFCFIDAVHFTFHIAHCMTDSVSKRLPVAQKIKSLCVDDWLRSYFQGHRSAHHWVSPSGFNWAEASYFFTVLHYSSFFHFNHLSFSICMI